MDYSSVPHYELPCHQFERFLDVVMLFGGGLEGRKRARPLR